MQDVLQQHEVHIVQSDIEPDNGSGNDSEQADSDCEQADDDLLDHDPDHEDQKRVRTLNPPPV